VTPPGDALPEIAEVCGDARVADAQDEQEVSNTALYRLALRDEENSESDVRTRLVRNSTASVAAGGTAPSIIGSPFRPVPANRRNALRKGTPRDARAEPSGPAADVCSRGIAPVPAAGERRLLWAKARATNYSARPRSGRPLFGEALAREG
jgi:hypothetical protein